MNYGYHVERAKSGDLRAVLDLLAQLHLPPDGLREHFGTAFVALCEEAVVGSAALEVYSDGALLRSLAVAAAWQGRGVGHDLTLRAIQLAESRKTPAIYLLTTTAETYFSRFGFAPIARTDVPVGIQTSVEWTSACPSSAVVMKRDVGG